MIRILLLALFVLIFVSCSSKGKIYITCDSTCDNPILFVDGKKIGVISELNHSGSYILIVDNGTRNIKLINSDKITYELEVTLKGEEYILVSFRNNG